MLLVVYNPRHIKFGLVPSCTFNISVQVKSVKKRGTVVPVTGGRIVLFHTLDRHVFSRNVLKSFKGQGSGTMISIHKYIHD